MALDCGLLAQARAAETRAFDAERVAEAARDEFYRALRRLQQAGGSLRESAEQFGLRGVRTLRGLDMAGQPPDRAPSPGASRRSSGVIR